MKIVQRDWGHENWLINNELYCAKFMTCKENWSLKGKYHFHKLKDETFYIFNGKLILDIEGREHTLKPTEKMRVRPNIRHRFKAKGLECKFLEVSTHHDDKDSYVVENE